MKKVVHPVSFQFTCCETNVGDSLVLMGDWLDWDEEKGLRMNGMCFPEWSCQTNVPEGVHQFKMLIVKQNMDTFWEPLEKNRVVNVGGACAVPGTFGKVPQSSEEKQSNTPRKSCERCGVVLSFYSNCPKCWGPVFEQQRNCKE